MALRIKAEDLERLREALNLEVVQIFARYRLEHYQKLHASPGNPSYRRSYIERYRWDVFHWAGSHDVGLIDHLYKYLNDDNIYAALKRLINE